MRFLLPIPILLALFAAGCATRQKTAQQQEAAAIAENSRAVEARRMRAVDSGEVAGTKRWAEIAVWDPNKTYDPSRSAVGGRTYDAGKARTKEFYYDRKTAAGSYRTRDFSGSKSAWAGDAKFTTKDASTRGEYGTKAANTKTAPTKEAWDAGKTAASKDLRDGKREYLGPESKKARQSIDPATLGDWRNGGESVVNSGSSVEKYSTLKALSIEDIRELLNKNK